MPIETYYGNPDDSHVEATVNLFTATMEHRAGNLTIRNRTMLGDYDRSYQNYVPGAVNAAQTLVALTAYNNATQRQNLFNQTDLTTSVSTGAIRHTLLAGDGTRPSSSPTISGRRDISTGPQRPSMSPTARPSPTFRLTIVKVALTRTIISEARSRRSTCRIKLSSHGGCKQLPDSDSIRSTSPITTIAPATR